MLFKTIFTTVAIAGSAMAGFDIRTGITAIYPSDAAESTSLANAVSKAIDSYDAVVSTQADFKSAMGAFYTYARTRDGIPEVVTATGTEYTRYTTLPDWYTAMPADALKVFESIRKQEDKILESVIPKAARTSGSQGAAPQATGMGLYTHGAIAAVVGVVAAAL